MSLELKSKIKCSILKVVEWRTYKQKVAMSSLVTPASQRKLSKFLAFALQQKFVLDCCHIKWGNAFQRYLNQKAQKNHDCNAHRCCNRCLIIPLKENPRNIYFKAAHFAPHHQN